jgi:1-acyl-sn-glycerol-3-phosphate acyltransferase
MLAVVAATHKPRSRVGGPPGRGVLLRSVVFNVLFYATTLLYLFAAMPAVLFPRQAMLGIARCWAHSNFFLLRVVCGITVEWRGRDKIPHGALIVASKHQSTWETFALITLFVDPTFIVKRELMWLPLFGWYMWKADMIPIDRGGRASAVSAMMARARLELQRGRQIIIFPEGTRRAPGAEPAYKFGVAKIYAMTGAPCLPIALNSGLVWPRRSFRRHPGIIRVEILDVIAPGLDENVAFERLKAEIESASARLIVEAAAELDGA